MFPIVFTLGTARTHGHDREVTAAEEHDRPFRFRARVRRESGYPYELGYSRKIRVRVR